MKAIRNIQIELDTQEITALQQAITILKKVNEIIDDVDYPEDLTVNTDDIELYDTLYDEVNKIENYIEY